MAKVCFDMQLDINQRVINLVRTQSFSKTLHFLSYDTHTYMYVCQRVKIASFSEDFPYVLSE